MSLVRRSCTLAVLIAFIGAAAVEAVPYASQVRNSTGDTWEFVLNEDADSFTVMRDGGSPFVVNNPTAGRHTFDMAGFSDFEIQVAKDAPEDWTEISDASNLHTYYFRPNGVVVNQDASSPYFGTVYISHPIDLDVDPGLGISRTVRDGIYTLSADLIGVDLANNFAAKTDAEDASLAQLPPNWTVNQNGGSSPWKLTLDDGGNLIAADFSDQHGGVKYASPDLQTGGLVLANEDGILPLLINNDGLEVHGSMLSKPSVTGTVGVDLTLWGIDEDYDLDGDTFTVDPETGFAQNSTFHPLRWDVGAATDYNEPPTVVINKESLTVADDNGTPGDESDDFNDLQFTLSPESLGGGVVRNGMHYEEQFDKFYLLQSRTHGNESGILIVTADDVDGNSPTIDWSSKRFSYDNGLDGNNSTNEDESLGGGIQDIFRNIDDLIISEDGSTMYVFRSRQFGPDDTPLDGDNPVLGLASNAPGAILVIPLDENGLPDLEVDDNGTLGDTSDDFLANIQSIPVDALGRDDNNQIGIDAAGNVYSVDNRNERLFVFSPGGNTLATTGSDGTFEVIEVGGFMADFNGDGVVDVLDLDILGTNFNMPGDMSTGDANGDGVVDVLDLDILGSEFNSGGSSLTAVPEPAGVLLALTCFVCGLGRRSRR